jgi:hypothetical protein
MSPADDHAVEFGVLGVEQDAVGEGGGDDVANVLMIHGDVLSITRFKI